MKHLFNDYSLQPSARFIFQETARIEPAVAEVTASQELIREAADLSDKEVQARIEAFIAAHGEEGVNQLRATIINYEQRLNGGNIEGPTALGIIDTMRTVEGLLDQAVLEHNTTLLEGEDDTYQGLADDMQERFTEFEVEAEIPSFADVVAMLQVNNQAVYNGEAEVQAAMTQYLEQFQADTEQAHKENFIRENFADEIAAALEDADFGDLNFDANSIIIALAEQSDLGNLEDLGAAAVTAFIEQFEASAAATTAEAIRSGAMPALGPGSAAESGEANNVVEFLRNFLRHLATELGFEPEGENGPGSTGNTGINSYAGRNALGANTEALRGSSAVVDRALDWHSQGSAGINGARHCTHWCELVYFGPGTPDGSHIHNLPKAIDMPVSTVSGGTGIGGSRGASVAQIDQLGPGSHIMLDHCRGGACNQGATHSAILLESPTNGVAQVVSYPGNGGAPRVETYTMTENGAGDSKRILRAHNPPA